MRSSCQNVTNALKFKGAAVRRRARIGEVCMAGQRHDFEAVRLLESDAVGSAGKRPFRVVVQSGEGAAVLLLEEEQLQAPRLPLGPPLSPGQAMLPPGRGPPTPATR